MQVRVFTIPMDGEGNDAVDELNVFLRSQKVLSVEKVAVVDRGRHFWSLCIEYLPRRLSESTSPATAAHGDANRPRIDYREILTKDEFDRYSQLRALREQLAEAEAVPVYTILTNAQLADLARTVPQTKTALAAIEGLGPAKLERYGEPLLALLRTLPAWSDAEKTKVGCEIPFNRQSYVFKPPWPLAEVDAELKVAADGILQMCGGVSK
jgi:ribonuclease D